MKNIAFDRRQFLTGSIAAGYALAVQPVGATAITTDADGLIAGPCEIGTSADGAPLSGYSARPALIEGDSRFPTIIVVHEIFGVHEFIKDVCRRFAKQGYLAIAPDLFQKVGDVQSDPDIRSLIGRIVQNAPDEQVQDNLRRTVAAVEKLGGDPARIGITGFCWGGREVWLYDEADSGPRIKAAVAWYGMVGKNPFGETLALDNVPKLTAPILGLYGGKDDSIPQNTLEAMRAKLKEDHKTGEIVIYPDAGHGFFADYRPSYDPKASADAWPRCLDWFAKYLR